MATVERDRYEDLWSDFESEFEEMESEPVALDLSHTPNKQRTIGVANLQLLFNGYYPALVLSLVAVLLGASDWQRAFLIVGASLLAFPLASVFSAMLRGPRRRLGYYAFTALLIGGGTELFLAAPKAALSQGVGSHIGQPSFVPALQDQMERYYSWSHWVVYLSLGVLVAHLAYKWQEQTPWMDSAPAGKVRKALAGALLSIPLLLPLGCLIMGSLEHERMSWYLREVATSSETLAGDRSAELWNFDAESDWSKLYQSWVRAGGEVTTARVQELEAAYLETAQKHTSVLDFNRRIVEKLLVDHRQDLKDPFRVSSAILEHAMVLHKFGGQHLDMKGSWNFLLEQLAAEQLTEKEARLLLKQLKAYDDEARSVIREASHYIAAQAIIRCPYGTGITPEPVQLFGQSFNNSPSQLYFLSQTRYVTDGWLQFEDELLAGDPQQQLDTIRTQKTSTDPFLRDLAEKQYDHELRPLWRTAAAIAACKLYIAQNQSPPEGAASLGLWFPQSDESWKDIRPVEFQLQRAGSGVKLTETFSDRSWIVK